MREKVYKVKRREVENRVKQYTINKEISSHTISHNQSHTHFLTRRLLSLQVDKLVLGGGMVFTFLKARGVDVGNSLVEDDQVS